VKSVDARVAKAEQELVVAMADSARSRKRRVLSWIVGPLGFYVVSKTEFWASEHLAEARHEQIVTLLTQSPPSAYPFEGSPRPTVGGGESS